MDDSQGQLLNQSRNESFINQSPMKGSNEELMEKSNMNTHKSQSGGFFLGKLIEE